MELWTLPPNYFGARWDGYYVFMLRNRDSSILRNHNFDEALDLLGGETGEEDDGISLVAVVRENHYAVGWIEWIAIHQTATKEIEIAKGIEERLDNYPILNEDGYTQKVFDAAYTYWQSMPRKERIRVCAKYNICIFAARRDDLPEDPTGDLVFYLSGEVS